MAYWRTTKESLAQWVRAIPVAVLCSALVALPSCAYSIDGQSSGQTGVDLSVEKPTVVASCTEGYTPDSENKNNVDVPESIQIWLPIGSEKSYSIDSRDVFTMDTVLQSVFLNEQSITASIVKVVVTDQVPDGFNKELKGTLWDYFPNYYNFFYPETCYMFVTFELTNLENTINYGVNMLNGSMVFLINDDFRIRWNTIWDEYPLYRDYSDDGGVVILQPYQVREVTLGYLIDKKAWFTEIDESEGWHFFIGVWDTARHKSWAQPVIGYYGWLIDDDAVIYQDFE